MEPDTGAMKRALHNHCAQHRIPCEKSGQVYDQENRVWICTWRITTATGDVFFSGTGRRKAIAFEAGAAQALEHLGVDVQPTA